MVYGRRAFTALMVVVVILILLSTFGEARARNKDDKGSKDIRKQQGDDSGQKGRHHHHHYHNDHHSRGDNRKKQKAGKANQERKDNKHKEDKKKKTHGREKGGKKSGHQHHNKDKVNKHGGEKKKDGRQHSLSTDIPCGPGRGECPPDRPCCSQWGYCGDDADYCLVGCQEAFGICGDSKRSHHHIWLKDKQWQYPNYDDQRFRIPTTYRGKGGRNNCHQRPYLPSSIPWASLDYVMFAFVYFDDNHQLYPADPSDEELYFEINRLKMATGTRVMISIGGWSFTHPAAKAASSTKYRFENMIRSRDSRRAFIKSCVEFCQFYGFDGVDIDYEYPAYKDREALFREMKEAFDAEGSGLVLSLAGASFQEGVQGIEMEKVAAYTDFTMIMAYGPMM
ncbi:hypothetical protein BGX33_004238 [Mortierella sp. NVP41]|nr:hypothetical protein BGX33_004238 [Mortierella sp. NVP41]